MSNAILFEIISDCLQGPEKQMVFISFQNILNNHYDKVNDIIRSFKGLTLKDANDFKVFTVKEMPQDLSKITFTDKYKKAVVRFYQFKNDQFVELLDTLPHFKKSAIFLLKMKLHGKLGKMRGGAGGADYDRADPQKYNELVGVTTRNIHRLNHALYAYVYDVYFQTASKVFKKLTNVSISSEVDDNSPASAFWDATTYKVGGGLNEDINREIQPLTTQMADSISEYIKKIYSGVINSEGYRQIKSITSPDKVSALVSGALDEAVLAYIVPLVGAEATEDVVEFVTWETPPENTEYKHLIQVKRIKKQFGIIETNLNIFRDKITEELLCVEKKILEEKKIPFDKLFDDFKKELGLTIDINCHRGGSTEEQKERAGFLELKSLLNSKVTKLEYKNLFILMYAYKKSTELINRVHKAKDLTEFKELKKEQKNIQQQLNDIKHIIPS